MFSGDLIYFVTNLPAVKTARAVVMWGWIPSAPPVKPTICIWKVDGNLDATHAGQTNVNRARIQFDILAGTADPKGEATVLTLQTALTNALVAVRQPIGATSGTLIQSATHEKDLDDFDGPAQSFRAITDITFEFSSTS